MNYALIGCGRIAVNHIKAAINNNLHIVAVCDVKPEAMENLLAQYHLEKNMSIQRYTDYKKMLEEKKPQLVAIATESGLHAQIALDCIDQDVNVIIEKPMAMRMVDAEEIIQRSKARNVKVCACHQNRFNNAVQETRSALETGRFGKLSHGSIHVRWNRNRNYYTQAPWRGTWAQDGGCLMNQCIHGIDLLRWMMGDEIEEVYGVTKRQFHEYLECEDVGMAVVKFKNGAIGTIEGTTEGLPHIGVNTTFLHPKIKLDYYFARDYSERSACYDELKNYDFVKFLGIVEWSNEGREIYQIPESIIEENHARRFITQPQKEFIHWDTEHYPVMGLGSIIFGALHFALFTMPKQIFLVGCDCSADGHFDGSTTIDHSSVPLFVDSWNWVKTFIKRYYPKIEVISINPIGLNGVFRDVYTENYLNAHPEIARSECEILSDCYPYLKED